MLDVRYWSALPPALSPGRGRSARHGLGGRHDSCSSMVEIFGRSFLRASRRNADFPIGESALLSPSGRAGALRSAAGLAAWKPALRTRDARMTWGKAAE